MLVAPLTLFDMAITCERNEQTMRNPVHRTQIVLLKLLLQCATIVAFVLFRRGLRADAGLHL